MHNYKLIKWLLIILRPVAISNYYVVHLDAPWSKRRLIHGLTCKKRKSGTILGSREYGMCNNKLSKNIFESWKSNFFSIFSIQFVLLKNILKILWALRKYCKWLRDDQYFFFCVPKKPNPTSSNFSNLESP